MSRTTFNVIRKFVSLSIAPILFFVLCTQVVPLLIQLNGNKINIPDVFIKKLERQLSKNELHFKISCGSIDSSGKITLEQIQAFTQKSSTPFLKSHQAYLSLKLLPLILGKTQIQDLQLKDTTLLCPPIHSPSGLPDPILNIPLISVLYKNSNVLQINQACLRLHNLDIHIEGDLAQSSKTKDPIKTIESILKVGVQCLNQKSLFESFDRPSLLLKLCTHKDGNGNLIAGTFYAEELSLNKDFKLGRHKCEFELCIEGDILANDARVFLTFNNLNSKKYGSVKNGIIRATFPLIHLAQKKIKNCNAKLFGITHEEIKADALEATFSSIDYPLIKGKLKLSHRKEWLEGEGSINTEARALRLKIEGSIRPETAKPYLTKAKIPQAINLNLDQHITLKGSATFSDNFLFKEGAVKIQIPKLKILGETWDYAETKICADQEGIQLTDISLSNPTSNLKGHYTQSYENSNYRLTLKGTFNPQILDKTMGPWWVNFWKDYTLHNKTLTTDLDLIGNWKNKSRYVVFGEVQGENFSYKNIPFSKFQTILYAKPSMIELSDFSMESPDGYAKGNIRWISDSKHKFSPNGTELNIESKFPLENLRAFITNPTTLNILDLFKCNKTPHCKFLGYFNQKTNKKNFFNLEFNSNGSLEFKGLPLDSLRFVAKNLANNTELENIQIGFADGIANSKASLLHGNHNETQLDFQCNLEKANYQGTLDAFRKYSSPEAAPPGSSKEGHINLEIKAKGILGDLASYNGEGKIKISNANLGKINMFGILSKILSVTPLALGSFQLTDVETNFRIKNDVIHFPNAEIYGSTAQIRAKGNYKITSEGLDFIMDVSPLGKVNVPVISHAFYLLTPLSQSFQIKVEGTSKAPQWDFKLTPLGFFKDKGPYEATISASGRPSLQAKSKQKRALP